MSDIDRKNQALKLFDTLVELSGAEREPRLLALAQSDPELAQELQRLLAADAAESGLLDHGIKTVANTVFNALLVDQFALNALCAGAAIGGFTLLRPLGEGGMGEVWLAERRLAQAQGDFIQRVALKLLKRGMDSDALVRRFVQERKILAELNHPHIARFVDGGVSTDGRLYYAMEFVEGVSIQEYVRRNKLDVRACVQLMSAVCDAVAHAQAHLVVHRDLKPSNILVDENAQPRVLDFGIAKLLDSSDPQQTATELRAMTPVYAAPEQILGEPISTATDVYALGVILYQLLTETLPHQRSGALISLAQEVRKETIQRPSTALRRSTAKTGEKTTSIEQARAAREIAGDLDTVLLMALRQEPARRYANAAALGSDLRAWLADMPVAAQVDTHSYRVRTFVRRNRGFVVSISAVILALIAGFSAAVWQAQIARAQLARAEQATLRANVVRDFFVARLEDAKPGVNNSLTMSDWMLASIPKIDSELLDAPEAQAEIGVSFAKGLSMLGRHAEAITTLDTALLRIGQLKYEDRTRVAAEALQLRGSNHLKLGNYRESERDLRQSLVFFDQVPGQGIKVRQGRLRVGTTLVGLSNSLGRTREALAIAQGNLREKIALLGADAAALAVDYNNVGAMLNALGRYPEARIAFARSLKLLETSGADSRGRAHVIEALVGLEADQGNLEQARIQLDLAKALRTAQFGADHIETLYLGRNEALLSLLQADVESADEILAKTLPEVRRSLPRFLGVTLLVQLQLRLVQQRNVEALAIASEMLALVKNLGNTAVPSYAKRVPSMRALATARLARMSQQLPAEQAKQAIDTALADTLALYRDAEVAPILQGEAAIYLAGAFHVSGQAALAKEWHARGLLSYQKSMSALAAQQRVISLVPELGLVRK